MSLLMDALRRAETSKQEAGRRLPGRPAGTGTLSLEPLAIEPGTAAANPLPNLAAHLEALDADLSRASQPEPRPSVSPAPKPSPASAAESREAVRNAFSAKLTDQPPSRLPLWLTLAALGLGAAGIGAYTWYQTSALDHGLQGTRPIPGRLAQPGLPPAKPASDGEPAMPSTPTAGTTATIPPQPEAAPPLPPQAPPPPAVRSTVDLGNSARAPIRLVRTQPKPDPDLMRGFADLQAGDFDRSRQAFEEALQSDPNNTDALLALAAIASRQGRPAEADDFRRRALVANPSDPAVQAANMNSAAIDADPNAAESHLKTLLSSHPESAALNFALGNLYARQSHWTEAQQAYFNAVAADGDNPDYLFNLAISLDHLRQPRLAAQHYRLALEAAARRPAAFDRNRVQKRLGELQAERQP